MTLCLIRNENGFVNAWFVGASWDISDVGRKKMVTANCIPETVTVHSCITRHRKAFCLAHHTGFKK
jgi:hypothetical protein